MLGADVLDKIFQCGENLAADENFWRKNQNDGKKRKSLKSPESFFLRFEDWASKKLTKFLIFLQFRHICVQTFLPP